MKALTKRQMKAAYDIEKRVKLIFLVLSITLGLGFILLGSQAAMAVGLKETAIVRDNMITLGDLFYGLEESEDKVLGAAPQPGSDMILNARTLMRVAVAMNLPWRPASSADQITIRRAATIIRKSDIQDSLSGALGKQGLKGPFSLDLIDGAQDILLPYDQPESFVLEDVYYDPQREWVEAKIMAPSAENPIFQSHIKGKIERLIPVPVMREMTRAGTIIGQRDIEIINLPARSVKSGMILSFEDIDGMTPRRLLHAGKPILDNEIEAPQIVSRGEMITITFEDGPLSLSTEGRALQNGAKGDVVRVVNSASNKTIQGLITADKQVSVITQ